MVDQRAHDERTSQASVGPPHESPLQYGQIMNRPSSTKVGIGHAGSLLKEPAASGTLKFLPSPFVALMTAPGAGLVVWSFGERLRGISHRVHNF